jgi:hypothetical protein
MRNLIILIVLCLAGYWVYQHYLKPPPAPEAGSQTTSQPQSTDQFAMPDPVAFKMRIFKANAPELVEVWLVHGNRWRVEARRIGFPGTIITVCDGSQPASTKPGFIQPDGIGPSFRATMKSLNGAKPTAAGIRDGHQCWFFKSIPDPDGTRDDIWVDQQTRFPVYGSGWTSGIYTEIHFQLLKSDFNILEQTCFNTSNTAPMLTPFLTP